MNVLTVTGRLTVDPARRDTPKGVVCEFRVAVDGQRRLWLPVTCWGHLAGRCAQHLRRGRHVAVSGPLLVDEYLTRNGDKQRRWYLKGEHVTFLDPPPDDDHPADDPANHATDDPGDRT
jgi:single-strand DNA-binding protein